MITVRIPVAIDINGNWIASGSSQEGWDWDDFMEGAIEELDGFYERYWIITEVPMPEFAHTSDPKELPGSVDPD